MARLPRTSLPASRPVYARQAARWIRTRVGWMRCRAGPRGSSAGRCRSRRRWPACCSVGRRTRGAVEGAELAATVWILAVMLIDALGIMSATLLTTVINVDPGQHRFPPGPPPNVTPAGPSHNRRDIDEGWPAEKLQGNPHGRAQPRDEDGVGAVATPQRGEHTGSRQPWLADASSLSWPIGRPRERWDHGGPCRGASTAPTLSSPWPPPRCPAHRGGAHWKVTTIEGNV
jgi:hypothetical protein